MSILFTAIFSGINMIWDRQFGFLKETLVAPVSRINIMFGRILGGATEALFQGILVLIISIIIGFHIHSYTLLAMSLLFMALISLFFTALGTAIASMLQDFQGFQLIMNFIVMPVFFLSGALFPLNGLPKALTVVADLDPLSYGVDGLHFALTGASHFGAGIDIMVLSVLTFILLVIGSYLFSKIEV
jgi:ABC-2 type transport system permease protein